MSLLALFILKCHQIISMQSRPLCNLKLLCSKTSSLSRNTVIRNSPQVVGIRAWLKPRFLTVGLCYSSFWLTPLFLQAHAAVENTKVLDKTHVLRMWTAMKMLDAWVSHVPGKSQHPLHFPLLQPLVEPGCCDDGIQIHFPRVAQRPWAHSQWASRTNHTNWYNQAAFYSSTLWEVTLPPTPPPKLLFTYYKGRSLSKSIKKRMDSEAPEPWVLILLLPFCTSLLES